MFSSNAQATQLNNAGLLYVNGLELVRTGNATLTMAIGQARDSTNTFDIPVNSVLTINAANVGVNGIDTGALAASKMYAVFLIFDPTYNNPVAALLSLSNTAPVLPFGYSAFRRIGNWGTNGSSQLYIGYWNGSANVRTFYYDAILATPLTAGTSTSFAAVNLVNLVPALDNLQVDFYPLFTAAAAGNTAGFRPTGSASVAGQHVFTAQRAGTIDQKVRLLTKLSSGNPSIDYILSAGTLALSIEGYVLNI